MKMKLAIAVALSHNAQLLLLDEATSGLDPIVRDEILDILLDFIQNDSRGVLFSSHITSDLEKIADYVTFIHKGRIFFSDPKDQLLEQYGILKCTEKELAALDRKVIKGVRRHQFGVEALVEKQRISSGYPVDKASIEDIMLFIARGGAPMKGLLLKDLCLLKKQMKLMVVFVIFYAICAVAAKIPSMMGTMVILLSIMMPITSMSYDEAGQWYRYAFSLPIPRRTLVLSKYVLGFLVALGGLVVSAIGNLVVLSLTNWENSLESWLIIVGFLEIGMIFLSIIIPVLFQFGVEKGRFLVVVIAVRSLSINCHAGQPVEDLRCLHAQCRGFAGNSILFPAVYFRRLPDFFPYIGENLPEKRILK